MELKDGTVDSIAVKAPKMCTLTQGAVVDFLQEAKTAMFLNHTNIVKCMGFSKEPYELPCLLFEYMDHGSLGDILVTNRTKSLHDDSYLKLSNVSVKYICLKKDLFKPYRFDTVMPLAGGQGRL